MLVIDLLQLIQDINKQVPFFYRFDGQVYGLILVQPEPTRLIITTTKQSKSLKQWELKMLLNKPEYHHLPVYLWVEQQPRPIFGFKLADQKAWLN